MIANIHLAEVPIGAISIMNFIKDVKIVLGSSWGNSTFNFAMFISARRAFTNGDISLASNSGVMRSLSCSAKESNSATRGYFETAK
jgi:hypothetical protein